MLMFGDMWRCSTIQGVFIQRADKNNKNPKPLVWIKSAGEILEKVNRAQLTFDNM